MPTILCKHVDKLYDAPSAAMTGENVKYLPFYINVAVRRGGRVLAAEKYLIKNIGLKTLVSCHGMKMLWAILSW